MTARPELLAKHRVTVTGSGPTLFMVHGFGTNQGMWKAVGRQLADFRIVCLDHAGSRVFENEHWGVKTLDHFSDDMIEIAKALNVTGAVYVGHSVGAMMAIRINKLSPDLFSGYVMIAASACYYNDGDYVGGYSKAELRELVDTLKLGVDDWSKTVGLIATKSLRAGRAALAFAESIRDTEPEFLRSFAELTFFHDVRDQVSSLDKPVLLIQAEDDPFVPQSATDFLLRSFPNCELRTVPVKGHFPHLLQPRVVANAISDWVGQDA
jgi:sigma-B regulation protein RsbQ